METEKNAQLDASVAGVRKSRRHPHSSSSKRHSSSRHSHRPALSKRLSRKERAAFTALLVLPWAIAAALLAWHLYAANQHRKELSGLEKQLREQQGVAESLRKQIETREAELAQLVENRLPGQLRPISFDQVINVENDMTKNVLFTAIRQGKKQAYEYRVVVENSANAKVLPEVRILVFDRLGIQIGLADITRNTDWEKLAAGGLATGESRSFSGGIELSLDRAPTYFMIMEATRPAPGS